MTSPTLAPRTVTAGEAAAGRAAPLVRLLARREVVAVLALGGPRWLGAITPLGGLCFILGWLVLAVSVMKSR